MAFFLTTNAHVVTQPPMMRRIAPMTHRTMMSVLLFFCAAAGGGGGGAGGGGGGGGGSVSMDRSQLRLFDEGETLTDHRQRFADAVDRIDDAHHDEHDDAGENRQIQKGYH